MFLLLLFLFHRRSHGWHLVGIDRTHTQLAIQLFIQRLHEWRSYLFWKRCISSRINLLQMCGGKIICVRWWMKRISRAELKNGETTSSGKVHKKYPLTRERKQPANHSFTATMVLHSWNWRVTMMAIRKAHVIKYIQYVGLANVKRAKQKSGIKLLKKELQKSRVEASTFNHLSPLTSATCLDPLVVTFAHLNHSKSSPKPIETHLTVQVRRPEPAFNNDHQSVNEVYTNRLLKPNWEPISRSSHHHRRLHYSPRHICLLVLGLPSSTRPARSHSPSYHDGVGRHNRSSTNNKNHKLVRYRRLHPTTTHHLHIRE